MQQKISVKFKIGTKVYYFLAEDLEVKVGDNVVVETILGLSLGKVDKVEPYDPTIESRELKSVLRVATKEDEEQNEKIKEKGKLAIQETRALAVKYKLDMNVVNAEYSLDGNKVVIDFIAEERVDFRELVKELATKLRTRIELRQIGIRDQAKMVGGIGICGRVCCCASHLKDFEKVSIKMAKTQGLALNPTKISGSCGRLMCCLAYEDNYYSEVYPKVPKLNKEVKTPDGIGVVVYTNALKQIASVKITANDGSSTIKDYSLDNLIQIEQSQNSSLQDYKNFSNSQNQNNSKNNIPQNNSSGINNKFQNNLKNNSNVKPNENNQKENTPPSQNNKNSQDKNFKHKKSFPNKHKNNFKK